MTIDDGIDANYCMNEADIEYIFDLQDFIEDYDPYRVRIRSLRNMIAIEFEEYDRDYYRDYDKEGYYDKKEEDYEKEYYYEDEQK